MHTGSVWGLWPENYEADHERVVVSSSSQKLLYKYWLDLIKKVARRKIDTVIFNGDNVDGPGYSARGREQMSPDMMDQVLAATQLIEMLTERIDPSEVFWLSGTDYHSAAQQDAEREIASIVGGKYVGLGPHDFMFGDITVNVAHGTGATYWYKGTKMDKTGFSMMLGMAEEGLYSARHIVRGHYHFEGYLHFRHRDMYVSPCWQAQTAYMRKKDGLKMVPDIGTLELTIEGEDVTPRFYGYPHPPRPKVEVRGYSIHPDEAKKKRRKQKW